MSINLKTYQALKERVNEASRERDKAEGVLETLKAELKKEFKCTTIKEAKKLLKELKENLEKDEKQFEKDLAAFEKEFGEVLE